MPVCCLEPVTAPQRPQPQEVPKGTWFPFPVQGKGTTATQHALRELQPRGLSAPVLLSPQKARKIRQGSEETAEFWFCGETRPSYQLSVAGRMPRDRDRPELRILQLQPHAHLPPDVHGDADDHSRNGDASNEGNAYRSADQRAQLPENLLFTTPWLFAPECAARGALWKGKKRC